MSGGYMRKVRQTDGTFFDLVVTSKSCGGHIPEQYCETCKMRYPMVDFLKLVPEKFDGQEVLQNDPHASLCYRHGSDTPVISHEGTPRVDFLLPDGTRFMVADKKTGILYEFREVGFRRMGNAKPFKSEEIRTQPYQDRRQSHTGKLYGIGALNV